MKKPEGWEALGLASLRILTPAHNDSALPMHFQPVLDRLDSVDLAQRFLSQLLLIVTAYDSVQDQASLSGLQPELLPSQMRVLLQGRLSAIHQLGVDHRHGFREKEEGA